MKSNIEVVSQTNITVTLTREEVLHIEAALDCLLHIEEYDDDGITAAAYLGMYEDEYDEDLAHRVYREFLDVRGAVA